MKNQKKVIVLLSGGADSATVLAETVKDVGKENVYCLNAYYGQRLDKEMECAKKITEYYGVEYITMDISTVMQFSNCSLLKRSTKEVSHSTYDSQLEEKDSKEAIDSYVPFRNGLLLSAATAIADSIGADEIRYGAHGSDYAYPDCSEEFVNAFSNASSIGTENHVTVKAPLVGLTKTDVIRKGLALGVPYHLTWSCYEGGEKPCGKCASCIDRINAFKANGVDDPTFKED